MSAVSITLDIGFTHSLGPACVNCLTLEARCAWSGGCCPACTHWTGYDAAGHPHDNPRRQQEHGTERGYHQHRTRREPPCIRCCAAHSLHNQRRAS